jgi:hypothetical protein
MGLEVVTMHLVQDGDQGSYCELGNGPSDSVKAKNFFSSVANIIILRRPLYRGVSYLIKLMNCLILKSYVSFPKPTCDFEYDATILVSYSYKPVVLTTQPVSAKVKHRVELYL